MCKQELLHNEVEVKEYINYQTGEKLDLERVSTIPDNAMLKVHPDLWSEWDFEKNTELGFDIWKLTKGINKKMWWKCPDCKSGYDASPNNRTRGKNCPYCAGKRVNHTNSLASKFPKLAQQWHPTKNGNLTPHDITYGKPLKVWWFCNICDISYQSRVLDKTKSQGCPYCSGHRVCDKNSLATLNPSLASEWHPSKNGDWTPNDTTVSSNKKVWWLGECGHEWEARIANRNKRFSGCPYCSGRSVLKGFNDMWTTNPELASLLANPDDGYKYTYASNKKVDWKCPDCESIIKNKTIYDVTLKNLPCHMCSDKRSYPEKVIRELFKWLNIYFENDISFMWSNKRRFDFYIPSLNVIIEAHGGHHYISGFETFGNKTLVEVKENDIYKNNLAIQNGINPEDYIIIDCKYSDFEYIKNNILNSRLTEIFNLSEVDWDIIFKSSQKSISFECMELWKKGLSIQQISKKLCIRKRKVSEYLRKWETYGFINLKKRVN